MCGKARVKSCGSGSKQNPTRVDSGYMYPYMGTRVLSRSTGYSFARCGGINRDLKLKMRSQLAFSWRSTVVARAEEDDEQPQASPRHGDASGRRVTFAVQNVPSSPLVYHAQYHSSASSDNGDERSAGDELARAKPSAGAGARPRRPPPPVKRVVAAKTSATASVYSAKGMDSCRLWPILACYSTFIAQSLANNTCGLHSCVFGTAVATPKPRARPGWDNQVARDSSLFDTSLKKSALFQARPGDRKREADDQQIYVRDQRVSSSKQSAKQSRPATAAPSTRRPSALTGWKTRKWGDPQSSGYMARSSYQLLPKPRKDYVKENIERIAGRPVEMLRNDKRPPRRGRSRNVFERLTAPRLTDLLVRTCGRNSDTTNGTAVKEADAIGDPVISQPTAPDLSAPTPPQVLETVVDHANEREDSAQASLVSEQGRSLRYPETQPSRSNSARSGSPRSSTRPPRQQDAYGLAFHRSGSPRSLPTSLRSRSSRTSPQPSYAARVFAVLDRDERRRIGVDQVLQGLRLLGVPATHNQVSGSIK